MERRNSSGFACATSLPSTRIVPSLTGSNRLIILSVVDLPEPDEPTSATNSPSDCERDAVDDPSPADDVADVVELDHAAARSAASCKRKSAASASAVTG